MSAATGRLDYEIVCSTLTKRLFGLIIAFGVAISSLSQVHADATCGAKDAEDLVEDAALKSAGNLNAPSLADNTQNLLSISSLAGKDDFMFRFYKLKAKRYSYPSRQDQNNINNEIKSDFQAAATEVLSSNYEVSLSETFQNGQDYAIKKCEGTLKFTTPNGAWASLPIDYQIIPTEDGKILLRWDGDTTVFNLFSKLTSEEAIERAKAEE